MAVEVKEIQDDFGKPMLVITDEEKTKVKYTVRRTNDGFSFWEVVLSSGKTPKELASSFTKLDVAERSVTRYIKKQPKSFAKKREENRVAMEKSREENK